MELPRSAAGAGKGGRADGLMRDWLVFMFDRRPDRAPAQKKNLHVPGGGGTLSGSGSRGSGLGISAPLLGGGLSETSTLLTLERPLLTGGGVVTGLVGLVEGSGGLDGLLLLGLLGITVP